MKIKFAFFLMFFVACCDLWSAQAGDNWGKWYKNQEPQSDVFAAEKERVRNYMKFKRNLLLSGGVVYINNMYPIIRCNYRQLVDILLSKSIVDDASVQCIKGNFVNGELVDRWNALRKFVRGIIFYLREVGASPTVIEGIREIYFSLPEWDDGNGRCSDTLLGQASRNLVNPTYMGEAWKFAHTEFLWAFDSYYRINGGRGGWQWPVSRFVLVSYLDMCEHCESFLLRNIDSIKEMGNFRNENYKILFCSFSPYKNSRSRSGEAPLLKVVLK